MTQVELPNLSRLQAEGTSTLDTAKKYVCRTEQEYLQCVEIFKWIKARKKEIKEEPEFKELVAQKNLLHKMHSAASTLEKEVMEPYDAAENVVENVMKPYVLEKKRLEQEEAARKQREADQAAAEEKELLALQAEIEGRPEEAAVIEQLPAQAPPVKVEKQLPRTQGMGTRQRWRWEVVNERLIPVTWWILNRQMITNHVNAMGDKVDIPGIRVVPDVSFSG